MEYAAGGLAADRLTDGGKVGYDFVPFPSAIWEEGEKVKLGHLLLFGYIAYHQRRNDGNPVHATDDELLHGIRDASGNRIDGGSGITSPNTLREAKHDLTAKGWLVIKGRAYANGLAAGCQLAETDSEQASEGVRNRQKNYQKLTPKLSEIDRKSVRNCYPYKERDSESRRGEEVRAPALPSVPEEAPNPDSPRDWLNEGRRLYGEHRRILDPLIGIGNDTLRRRVFELFADHLEAGTVIDAPLLEFAVADAKANRKAGYGSVSYDGFRIGLDKALEACGTASAGEPIGTLWQLPYEAQAWLNMAQEAAIDATLAGDTELLGKIDRKVTKRLQKIGMAPGYVTDFMTNHGIIVRHVASQKRREAANPNLIYPAGGLPADRLVDGPTPAYA